MCKYVAVTTFHISLGIGVTEIINNKCGLQGHSWSLVSVPFGTTYDFLLVTHCTYVSILIFETNRPI